MSRKQKRMGPVGCFGQIENIKRQSLNKVYFIEKYLVYIINLCNFAPETISVRRVSC